jgi:signal transduction histidine kinase
MKPGHWVFWLTDMHAFRLWLVAPALVFLLGIAACGSRSSDDTATHFTRAQLLVTAVPEGANFAQPPREITASTLPSTGWQDVNLPHKAAGSKETSAASPNLVHWYQLEVAAFSSSEPRYLYLPRWKNSGQIAVYANGRLLYQTEGSLAYNGYNRPLLIRLDGTQAAQPTKLLLRLERLAASRSSISTAWVGTSQALAWRYQIRQFLQIQLPFMGSAAFLMVGFFSLAIWTRRRHEWIYFIFFAASTMAFLRMLHYFTGGSYLPMSDAWFTWLKVVSLIWLIVLVNNFFERLHKRPLQWLNPALIVVATLCSLVTIPDLTGLVANLELLTPTLYLILVLLTFILFAVAFRNTLQSEGRDIKLMAAWAMFSVPSSIYDVALQHNLVSPEGLFTSPYVIIGLFVMFTYIMYRRYMGAIDEVEEVNANLVKRLEAREAELAASYDRLRDIERYQTIVQERERLTQDMHDGLGSSLVTALRVVESGRMNDAQLGDVLKGCIDDLKLTLDSMESVEADLLLLLATLRFRIGPRLQAAGITLKWEVTDLPKLDWLDPRNALHILRILQEAFANILKHTRATEIRVTTAAVADGVQVCVADNGQGFDADQMRVSGTGHGMQNQQRRAQAISGSVSWVSDAAGTRFTLWLPWRRITIPT